MTVNSSGAWGAVLALLIASTAAIAQPAAPLKGRLVGDVLKELQAQGLNVVFSDALVPPTLRVSEEPRGATPRAIATEILAAHGLALRQDARGALLVVKRLPAPARQEQPPPAPSREDGWIEGIVRHHASQQPVASAVVVVEDTGAYAITGEDGRVRIDNVPAGVHTLRVEAAAYEPVSSPELKVSARRGTTVAIDLVRAPQFEELVTVSAPAERRPPGVTTSSFDIGSEEVRRSAGSLGDINRFVQSMPGLSVVDDRRNDLVTRGGSPSENLIRVDGFETPTISHFSALGTSGGVIALLNNELIADAQFLSGGFPAEYGDRLSSVLDIRLREGNRTRQAFELDSNVGGLGLIGEGPLGSRGSWLASARSTLPPGGVQCRDMSAYTVKVVFDLGQRHKLWATSAGGMDSVGVNVNDDLPDEPDFVGVEQSGGRAFLGVAWQHLFGSRAFGVLSLSSYGASYDVDVRDRQLAGDTLILRDHSSESATTTQYDVSWEASRRWTIHGGTAVKMLGRHLDLAQPRGFQTPYSDRPREDTPGVTLRTTATSAITSAYVQTSAQVLPRTTLTGGIRLERFAALNHALAAGPRGGIEIRAASRLRVSLSGGRYHQHPELVTVVAEPRNENLKPIEADHLVAGVRYDARPGLIMSAEVYRKWYRSYPVSLQYPQLTLANHGSELNTSDLLLLPMASAGKGRARGLELFVKKRLDGGLYGQVAYSWSKTEQAALDGVFRRGAFDLPHIFTAVGGHDLGKRWAMSSRFTLASGRPYTPALLPQSIDQNRLVFDAVHFNTGRLPAFHRLDLRVDQKGRLFGRSAVFVFEIQNIYNNRSAMEYSWNQRTREIYVERHRAPWLTAGVNIEF